MNRNAISPVIASILMMVVIVALVIVLYGFTTGFIGGTSSATVESSFSMIGSTSTGSIDAISVTQNEVYVRLTNDVGTTIDAVYIDNNKVSCDGGSRTLTPSVTEDLTLGVTECPGMNISSTVFVKVTGSNSYNASGMAGTT